MPNCDFVIVNHLKFALVTNFNGQVRKSDFFPSLIFFKRYIAV